MCLTSVEVHIKRGVVFGLRIPFGAGNGTGPGGPVTLAIVAEISFVDISTDGGSTVLIETTLLLLGTGTGTAPSDFASSSSIGSSGKLIAAFSASPTYYG